MRPGSPTHSFDMEQRLVGLTFTSGGTTLTVTGPPDVWIAPPGYYMLFLLNRQGQSVKSSDMLTPTRRGTTTTRRFQDRPWHWAGFELAYSGKIVAEILFLEDNKAAKLAACVSGTWNGLLGRSGPLRAP
jgi:hypothetical protein